MLEEFKIINDYPNYKISNFGRIYSEKTKIFLKPGVDNVGYLQTNFNNGVKKKYFRIHRLVAIYFIDNPNNFKCVDHIDKNKLNNDVNNLRWCSYSQNFMNKNKRKVNKDTSKYKGVYHSKQNKGWCSQICIDNKKIYLGTFKWEIEAAIAYNNKAIEIFGEFASLNQIEN